MHEVHDHDDIHFLLDTTQHLQNLHHLDYPKVYSQYVLNLYLGKTHLVLKPSAIIVKLFIILLLLPKTMAAEWDGIQIILGLS